MQMNIYTKNRKQVISCSLELIEGFKRLSDIYWNKATKQFSSSRLREDMGIAQLSKQNCHR